jgi:hypothetical protein
MADTIRFYDRALSRLSRRELLNVALKLGLTAIVPGVATEFAGRLKLRRRRSPCLPR